MLERVGVKLRLLRACGGAFVALTGFSATDFGAALGEFHFHYFSGKTVRLRRLFLRPRPSPGLVLLEAPHEIVDRLAVAGAIGLGQHRPELWVHGLRSTRSMKARSLLPIYRPPFQGGVFETIFAPESDAILLRR
jgi:hypothetical protein